MLCLQLIFKMYYSRQTSSSSVANIPKGTSSIPGLYVSYGQTYQQPQSYLNSKVGTQVTHQRIGQELSRAGLQSNLNQNHIRKLKNKFKIAYAFPSNEVLALRHVKANRLGKKIIKAEPDINGKIHPRVHPCACCDNIQISEEFPLCYDTWAPVESNKNDQKYSLPGGTSMFFTFIKMSILFLLLRMLTIDIINIFLSPNGEYCRLLEIQKTSSLCILNLSPYNLNTASGQQYLEVLDICVLVNVFLSIIFCFCFRRILKIQQSRLSLEFADDNFTVLLENIPKMVYDNQTTIDSVSYDYQYLLKATVTKWIEEWLQKTRENLNKNSLTNLEKNVKKYHLDEDPQFQYRKQFVLRVVLCYDLTGMENINKMRDQLIEQLKDQQEDNRHQEKARFVKDSSIRMNLINQKIITLSQHYTSSNKLQTFKFSHFTGKAFVTFEYQFLKNYFIEKYQQNPIFFQISGKPIVVGEANKPTDVYWFNMKVTDGQRFKNVLFSIFVLVMLLVLSFFGLFLIQFFQRNEQQSSIGVKDSSFSDTIKSYLFTGIMGLITFLINKILQFVMELLSTKQQHQTQSRRLQSLVLKTVITQTINTCLIYVLLNIIFKSNPLGETGLVKKIISLVTISGVSTLLTAITLPSVLFGYLYKKCTLKKTQQGKFQMAQSQLNKNFELPSYDFNSSYSYYIIQCFVVSCFGFLVPLATPIVIIFFCLQYWVDKWNIFRRFSTPLDFSYKLTQIIISIFEFSIVFFALGHLIWDLNIHYDTSHRDFWASFVSVLIAVLYVLFFLIAKSNFKEKVLCVEVDFKKTSYSEYMTDFHNLLAKTYQSENPATSCLRDIDFKKKKQDEKNLPNMRENYQKSLEAQCHINQISPKKKQGLWEFYIEGNYFSTNTLQTDLDYEIETVEHTLGLVREFLDSDKRAKQRFNNQQLKVGVYYQECLKKARNWLRQSLIPTEKKYHQQLDKLVQKMNELEINYDQPKSIEQKRSLKQALNRHMNLSDQQQHRFSEQIKTKILTELKRYSEDWERAKYKIVAEMPAEKAQELQKLVPITTLRQVKANRNIIPVERKRIEYRQLEKIETVPVQKEIIGQDGKPTKLIEYVQHRVVERVPIQTIVIEYVHANNIGEDKDCYNSSDIVYGDDYYMSEPAK